MAYGSEADDDDGNAAALPSSTMGNNNTSSTNARSLRQRSRSAAVNTPQYHPNTRRSAATPSSTTTNTTTLTPSRLSNRNRTLRLTRGSSGTGVSLRVGRGGSEATQSRATSTEPDGADDPTPGDSGADAEEEEDEEEEEEEGEGEADDGDDEPEPAELDEDDLDPINSGVATPSGTGASRKGAFGRVKKETKNIKGEVYTIIDDELILPDDARGESKIDGDGNLLGGRKYKLPIFTSPLRSNASKQYMLSIDAARAAGFRDSLYFFRRNPLIHKLSCTQFEKDRLIELGKLSGNLKSRAVTMVSARNCFKVMGATFVENGKYVFDDYYEDKTLAVGHKPGEPAWIETYDPEKDTGTLAAAKGPAPAGATGSGLNMLLGHSGRSSNRPLGSGRLGSSGGIFGSGGGGVGGGVGGGGGSGVGSERDGKNVGGGGGGDSNYYYNNQYNPSSPYSHHPSYHTSSSNMNNVMREDYVLNPMGGGMYASFGGNGFQPFGKTWDPVAKKAKPAAHLSVTNWMFEYAKSVAQANRHLDVLRKMNVGQVQVGVGITEREEDTWIEVEEEVDEDDVDEEEEEEGMLEEGGDENNDGVDNERQDKLEVEGDEDEKRKAGDLSLSSSPLPELNDRVASPAVSSPGGRGGSTGVKGRGKVDSPAPGTGSTFLGVPSRQRNGSGSPAATRGSGSATGDMGISRSVSPALSSSYKKRRLVKVYNPLRGVYDPETNIPHVYQSTQPTRSSIIRTDKTPHVYNDEIEGEGEGEDEGEEGEGKNGDEDADEAMSLDGTEHHSALRASPAQVPEARKRRKVVTRKGSLEEGAAIKAGIATIEYIVDESTMRDPLELNLLDGLVLLPGMWDFRGVHSLTA